MTLARYAHEEIRIGPVARIRVTGIARKRLMAWFLVTEPGAKPREVRLAERESMDVAGCRITLWQVRWNRSVKLAFDAPRELPIWREELGEWRT